MSSTQNPVNMLIDNERLIGRVKWFNNKAGYGFITMTNECGTMTDIFVHHSAINVDNQQYKYLVQGEYVEFNLVKTETKSHELQAAAVAGIKGGKLMCETRSELTFARNKYASTKQPEELGMEYHNIPRETTSTDTNAYSVNKQRNSSVPRETNGDKKWTLAKTSDRRNSRGKFSSRVVPRDAC